jgi:rod shape determining protein RodA
MNLPRDSGRRSRLSVFGRVLRWAHMDPPLLAGIASILTLATIVLYSASGQSVAMMEAHAVKVALAVVAMLVAARVDPVWLRRGAPWLYVAGLVLLAMVLVTGEIAKGGQRWLDFGIRFQPSEIMKLAVPMTLACVLHDRPLPPSFPMIVLSLGIVIVPTMLIAVQPDLGTAVLITLTGCSAIFLAGLRWRYIIGAGALLMASLPALWFVMHDYQRKRIMMLLDPDSDPLGAGYHIIQSKIAIGSGGFFGKGWLNGSQGQLEFLPERSTDFIFAVIGEEWGLMGALALMGLYLFVVTRGMYIALTAPDTFTRLLAGTLSITFFFYVFVNSAMVTGLIPVVGVPLPLVSAGGTSMVTLLAGFGILMSIQTHRKLGDAVRR